MSELEKSRCVEPSEMPAFVENAVQFLGGADLSTNPPQDFCWRKPMILTIFVRIVWLVVVVGNPFGVSGKDLSPGSILSPRPNRRAFSSG